MIQSFFHNIAATLAIPLIMLLNAGGYQAPPQPTIPAVELPAQLSLGSTNPIPDTIALFTTSLQAPITTTATTMTLVSATYNGGASTLASSTYGFIIDEGTSVEEIVTADCTATACTNMTRGIDRLSGSTTVAALEYSHRRGASVKITDAPSTLIHNRILQGIQGIPLPLFYSPDPTFTAGVQLVDKTYVDAIAFSGAGVVNATTGARGISQLATALQTASSTATGSSGASLVITASNATSTFNTATAGLKVVVTQNNGKIDPNFIATSSAFYTNITTVGTTTMATTTINGGYPFTLSALPTYVTNTKSATTSNFIGRDYLHMISYGSSTNYSFCMVLNGDYNPNNYTVVSKYSGNCTQGFPIGGAQFSSGQQDLSSIDIAGASGTPKIITLTTTTWRNDSSKIETATTTAYFKQTASSSPPITSVTIFDSASNNVVSSVSYVRVYSDSY